MLKIRLLTVMVAAALLSVVFAACTQTTSTPDEDKLEGVRWKLELYGVKGSMTAVLEGTEVTAKFDSDAGRIEGSTGCNTYFADYEITGSKFTITQLAYTEMACMDPEGVMDQEADYLRILRLSETFQVDSGELQITSGDDVLIYKSD